MAGLLRAGVMRGAAVGVSLVGSADDVGARDDVRFFAEWRDRDYRIRLPLPADEHEAEFRQLGDHLWGRRRVVVFRGSGGRLCRIPFLLFADETVEDRDEVLGPIVAELMMDAAKRYADTSGLKR